MRTLKILQEKKRVHGREKKAVERVREIDKKKSGRWRGCWKKCESRDERKRGDRD